MDKATPSADALLIRQISPFRVGGQLRAANPRRSPARAGWLKCRLARVRGPPAGEPRSQRAQPCNQPASHVPSALACLVAPKRGRVRQSAITLPLGVLSADGLKCEGITVIQSVQAPVSPYVRAQYTQQFRFVRTRESQV